MPLVLRIILVDFLETLGPLGTGSTKFTVLRAFVMGFSLSRFEIQQMNPLDKIKCPRLLTESWHPVLQPILLALPPRSISYLPTSSYLHCFFPNIDPHCLSCPAFCRIMSYLLLLLPPGSARIHSPPGNSSNYVLLLITLQQLLLLSPTNPSTNLRGQYDLLQA